MARVVFDEESALLVVVDGLSTDPSGSCDRRNSEQMIEACAGACPSSDPEDVVEWMAEQADLSSCESGAAVLVARVGSDGGGTCSWCGDVASFAIGPDGHVRAISSPHRCRGTISSFVGDGRFPKVSTAGFSLKDGESLAVLSDGVWSHLGDAGMAGCATAQQDRPLAARLVSGAHAGSGDDCAAATATYVE